MSSKKQQLSKLGVGIGLLFFSVVYAFVFMNSVQSNWIILWSMLFLILGGELAYLAVRGKNVKLKNIFSHIFPCMVLLQLVCGYFLMVEFKTWDIYNVYKNAVALATGNAFDSAYFARYPNNLGLLLILTTLYKFTFSILHSTSVYWGMILNIIAIDSALLISMNIALKIGGTEAKYACGILCSLFAPFYLFVPIFYTDTIVLPFFMGAILILLHLKEKLIYEGIKIKVLFGYILWGGFLYLGIRVKGDLAILLISAFIYLFLAFDIKKWLKACTYVLVGIIGVAIIWGVALEGSELITDEEYERNQYPVTHWIMMGLQGKGNYNQEDSLYTSSFTTYEERKDATIKEIKNRIQQMKISGMIKQLFHKAIDYGWNYGTYYAERYLGDYGDEPILYNGMHEFVLTKGRYFSIFWLYTQGLYLIIFLLMVIGLAISVVKTVTGYEEIFLQITLIGGLLFFMIWETHPRYLFHYSLIMIILAVCAISNIQKFWVSHNWKG